MDNFREEGIELMVYFQLGVSRQPSGTSVSFAAFNTAIWNKTLSQPDRDDLQSVLTGLDDLGKHPPNGESRQNNLF